LRGGRKLPSLFIYIEKRLANEGGEVGKRVWQFGSRVTKQNPKKKKKKKKKKKPPTPKTQPKQKTPPQIDGNATKLGAET